MSTASTPARAEPITPLSMRVLDLSTGIAGGYCAKLLSDAGAKVIKLEPPGGDPLRSRSASGSAVDVAAGSPLFQYLHGGHRSAVVDLTTTAGRDVAQQAAATADVVLESYQPGAIEDLGLGPDALHVRNPATSLVSLSAFGRGGPWSSRAATEFTLQAWCGSLAGRGIPGSPPVGVGGAVGEYVTGAAAASAAAFAVLAARRSGRGQHIDVSMLETMLLSFVPYQLIFAQFEDRLNGRSVEIPSIEPAADGWVGFCTITHQQWADFAALIERPEYGDDPTLSHAAIRMPRREELKSAIADWTTKRTVAEMVELASLLRIPVTPVGDGRTVLEMEHFAEREVFQQHPAGFTQPRRPYLLGHYPSPQPKLGPRLDEYGPELRRELSQQADVPGAPARTPAPTPAKATAARPLEGMRVVAFVAFWAGPFVASYLAAMGADVIKVESIQRPDGMRFAGGVKLGDPQVYEWSAVTHGANVGLRDVTLDLSRPEGVRLAMKLVEGADIVLDNFSPHVLDGLGLGEPELRGVRPDVVIVRMPAFGLDGPWRDRGGFAMTVEQTSGLAWLTGFPDDGPLVPRGVCDVLGGLHTIVALLSALEHRRSTGEGLLVEAPLIEAALNIAAEQTIEWTANGVLLTRQGNRSFQAAPQGVYACADEDDYVVLSVVSDEQWTGLRAALGSPAWASDERLSTAAGRHAAHDDIDAALTEWLRDWSAIDAVEHFARFGVPAAPTLDSRRLNDLPQIRARGWLQPLVHPVAGRLEYQGLPMTFSAQPRPVYTRAAPTLGEDNDQVLTELGLSADEIATLAADRIIGTRPAWL